MISVIIPTYNRGYIIKDSIQSVLNQTYKKIEVIVVDDNSTDNTQYVVESLNDNRVKYIKLDKNRGACYARNIGIKSANGKYIAFQDSDDIWFEKKLEKQKDFLELNNLDIVGCKMIIVHEEGNKKRIFPSNTNISHNSIYFNNFISTQLLFGKKECFMVEMFDENLPSFQDWELVILLVQRFNVSILDEVLAKAIIQSNSITKNPIKAIDSLNIIMKKHSINEIVEANYLRLIGIYSLQAGIYNHSYFKRALRKNWKDKKIIIDFLLSSLRLNSLQYYIYKKKGRFN